MGTMEIVVFNLFTWIPVIALIAAIILTGIGIFLRIHKKPCKKVFNYALKLFIIPVIYVLIHIIIGMIGFGPGPFS